MFKQALAQLRTRYPGKFDAGMFSPLVEGDAVQSARCIAGWTMYLASVGEIIPEAVKGAERNDWCLEQRGHEIAEERRTWRRRRAAACRCQGAAAEGLDVPPVHAG